MEQQVRLMQQQLTQVAGDLAQLKAHIDLANAQTATAVAEQGEQMTLHNSDLRKLHDVAEEAIRKITVQLMEEAANPKEEKEQKWHLARPKNLLPSIFAKDDDWKKWKE